MDMDTYRGRLGAVNFRGRIFLHRNGCQGVWLDFLLLLHADFQFRHNRVANRSTTAAVLTARAQYSLTTITPDRESRRVEN
jgi:hypothetical protein